MNWSSFQIQIFDAVEKTSDSLTIEAVAGSGKTTTIIEAINHVPRNQSVAFLAFNKSIADELKRRVTAVNARCMTLHSAGFAAWRTLLGNEQWDCKVDSSKTRNIVKEILEDHDRFRFGGQMSKLIGIAKGAGIVPHELKKSFEGLMDDEDGVWEELIEFYDIDRDMCNIEVARTVLVESINMARTVIDYDDMLFMPVITNAPFEKFDVVFLDEAQDVNALQIEMVSRMRKPNGRVIAVGDRHQAIYGFRGSLSESITHIQKRFNCRSLPLSVSYRCPQSVVRKAQEFVPHIQFHESAPEGTVTHIVDSCSLTSFLSTDAILCRNSRPLIELAFTFIRNKVSCRVLGRDIGQGLVSLVRKMKATTIDGLEMKLDAYRVREIVKTKGDEAKIGALQDKLATLQVFIDEVSLHNNSVEGVIRAIESLFSDDGASKTMLTLATIHKAKGLQWLRVFVLDADKYMPSKWAKQPWQKIQESNLSYVACTRAMSDLYYISSENFVATTLPDRVELYDAKNEMQQMQEEEVNKLLFEGQEEQERADK